MKPDKFCLLLDRKWYTKWHSAWKIVRVERKKMSSIFGHSEKNCYPVGQVKREVYNTTPPRLVFRSAEINMSSLLTVEPLPGLFRALDSVLATTWPSPLAWHRSTAVQAAYPYMGIHIYCRYRSGGWVQLLKKPPYTLPIHSIVPVALLPLTKRRG